MSHSDYLHDASDAIDLLRRIDRGDEAAFREIRPLLDRMDGREARRLTLESEQRDRSAKRKAAMRLHSGRFEIAKAYEDGVSYCAAGIVLLRNSTHRLVWRSGGTYFSGRGTRNYAPADLDILGPRRGGWPNTTGLTLNHRHGTTCRLSRELVIKHAQAIDAVFGEGSAVQAAKLERTVVVPDPENSLQARARAEGERQAKGGQR